MLPANHSLEPTWPARALSPANEQIIEVDEIETKDPSLQGEMTITITLADGSGGTDLLAVHDGLLPRVSPADNEIGWRMALTKLAAFVEAERRC